MKQNDRIGGKRVIELVKTLFPFLIKIAVESLF